LPKASSENVKKQMNKVVYNITQIFEKFVEKCSVSSIEVDERNKKLIITSSDDKEKLPVVKEEPPDIQPSIDFSEDSLMETDASKRHARDGKF
jgi:hypothetical protein